MKRAITVMRERMKERKRGRMKSVFIPVVGKEHRETQDYESTEMVP